MIYLILPDKMARKIESIDDMPVDPVEAVKRSFIHRGLIPRKYRRNSPIDKDGQPVVPQTVKNETKTSQPNPKPRANVAGLSGDEVKLEPAEHEPGETHEKLIDITEKAHDTLFKADSVFPFTLFPDTISLDREKVTIANRSFFKTANIITVPVSSMVSAEATVGPFFGSIHMTSKYFVQNTHTVHFLWRKDAIEIHRLLQGYIIAQERNVDVSEVEKEDLIALLHDLGQGVSD